LIIVTTYVKQWQIDNPEEKPKKCIQETSLSKKTVYKG